MIVLATLLALQGAAQPAPRIKPQIITPKSAPAKPVAKSFSALEQTLSTWKGRWGFDGGKFVCETRVSSGDISVDAVGCKALLVCLSPSADRMNAIVQGEGDDRDKANVLNTIVSEAAPCVAQTRHKGLADLAQLRGIAVPVAKEKQP